jgi:putative nucleotidyltransferase with HDIG domain
MNMAEYNRRVDEALASISEIKEIVEKNDIILRAGQRVNERQERVLREMARILRSQSADQPWVSTMLPALARILLVLAAFSALYVFLFHFRPDMFNSNPKLLALFMVFALQLVLVYLLGIQAELSIYLYPVALLPVMVTILFDAEVGLLATIVLAVLLGIMHRFDFTLSFMTVVVGTVGCFTSRRVRKRSEFFRIMYSVALTFALYAFLVETLKLTPNSDILTEAGYGVVNGVVTTLLAMSILPFFESLFGITTDITLLELSDPNHPLLKRLALEAPGTYHHSIIVGNLTEAAATAIGANALLARVGAYFHDIGKIEIPEYFVENQLSVKSKHDELTPSMSSIILSSHVKMGRQLGEEAGIPDDVLNFIEEHHGTMVQSYFYNKAVEQGAADDESLEKFRYPGPKPQTRETGIAMLADAVEAASRTLDDPKPARINNLIQRIINDRFQSGELEQCPLTLRDLARIKEAFAQVLIGAFHHRVVYPKKDKSEDE